MSNLKPTLFESIRMELGEAQELTIASLNVHGSGFDTWVMCWSGGKDSTALVTLIISLIGSGHIKRPKRLVVLRADTRLEMLPLELAANDLSEQIRAAGVEVIDVRAELDDRFFVYMLGRGVPPPNSKTNRWCTRKLKLDPMDDAVSELFVQEGGRVLVLTGVRIGESAARDARIKLSCGKDDGECGQGWFQESISEKHAAKLAPLLHWRTCLIWDWLGIWAPKVGWNTRLLAEAYDLYEGEENTLRTGCMGCPLVEEDTTLLALTRRPAWSHLAPILGLKKLYDQMREPKHRLRKHGERNKDGSYSANHYRMGPLTMSARQHFLAQILAIQDEVNALAVAQGRPPVELINAQELARIQELMALNTWPDRWDGTEPLATIPYVDHRTGSQATLF